MTSKEAFEEIIKVCNLYHRQIANVDVESIHGYPIKKIEKDLEVLEIIKTKNVDISLVKNCYGALAYAVYNSHIDEEKNDKLTKEEYDLLKEWLEK